MDDRARLSAADGDGGAAPDGDAGAASDRPPDVAPGGDAGLAPDGDAGAAPDPSPDAAPSDPTLPNYKGAPLDADRGPGLGCFWIQVALLVALLILTPVSVWLAMPPWLSAAFLLLTLGLLFFVGQTSIFLLRLVAADRRSQRRPLREGARPTVGQLENESPPEADGDARSDEDDATPR